MFAITRPLAELTDVAVDLNDFAERRRSAVRP